MDIIISANEKILTLIHDNKLSKNMTREEYTMYINKIVNMVAEDEEEIQKVPI